MRIWIDDIRPKPEGFDVRVKNFDEFFSFLIDSSDNKLADNVELVSFDHDLGEETNGYDIAVWVERYSHIGTLDQFDWEVHSDNPSGRERIRQALENADKFWEENMAK